MTTITNFADLMIALNEIPESMAYTDCDTTHGRYPHRAARHRPDVTWTTLRLCGGSAEPLKYEGEPLTYEQIREIEATGRAVFNDTPTRFVNLTPHAISIADADGQTVLTIPASGTVARMVPYEWQEVPRITTARQWEIPGVQRPIEIREHRSMSTMAIEGLPDRRPNTVYLVSVLCLDAAAEQGRTDVYAPATGPDDGAVRDERGQIAAVRRLVRATSEARR